MFEIGDKAVYPGHGVGVIEKIETREISGIPRSFYVLRILDNGMTIMIPTDHAQMVGLREIIPEFLVPKVLKMSFLGWVGLCQEVLGTFLSFSALPVYAR